MPGGWPTGIVDFLSQGLTTTVTAQDLGTETLLEAEPDEDMDMSENDDADESFDEDEAAHLTSEIIGFAEASNDEHSVQPHVVGTASSNLSSHTTELPGHHPIYSTAPIPFPANQFFGHSFIGTPSAIDSWETHLMNGNPPP